MNQPFHRPLSEGFLVLDFGSQYTLLIARRLRELGYYTEVIDGIAEKPPASFRFHGLILSGGPDSLLDQDGRQLPEWVLRSDVPILGICYGLQLLVHHLGGKIRSGHGREYGRSVLAFDDSHAGRCPLLGEVTDRSVVWMSHGDDIDELGEQWRAIARTDAGIIAAISHTERPLYGLQFHPEVQHTEGGSAIFEAFAEKICRAPKNWQLTDMKRTAIEGIQQVVGDGRVLVAVSGGVDSTVASVLMIEALGPERVTAVFVDHGLLRKDEARWVVHELTEAGIANLHLLERQDRFLKALAGVQDPEQKRKIIGRTFIEEFERFAKQHEGEFTHLGQGTLYPDVIESAGHGAGAKVIKSHHNVGGLPERLALELVEPFRYLFKDEVRAIGDGVGLPHQLIHRHPFPGPGLAVRILGEITPERVKTLQEADHIFIEALHEDSLYEYVWQAFAVLLPVQTVGVMGDQRTYQNACALRAVTATDGMTAGVGALPMEFLTKVSDRIVRNVDGINRVVYDITSKPPATIEWE